LVNGTTKDTTSNTDVPTSVLTPLWVTTDNMASTVVKDAAVSKTNLCVAALAAACSAAGIK
jgi:D-xylose transport system substrate-binding protein